jgi:glucose-6-phosphate 1-dehydrogenase
MALPPEVFIPVSQNLKKWVYPEKGIARLIVTPSGCPLTQVEKPFGHDLQSSRELQKALTPNWTEDEVATLN